MGNFVANLSYGGIRGGVLCLNTLILTPILIFRLGREQFSILALATPFLRYGFNGVFDLGLATGLVRFLSRDFVSGDYRNVNEYFTSATLLYGAGGLSLLISYRLLSPMFLPWILGADAHLYASAHLALWQLAWVYALLLLSNPFFALLMGVQKVHLSHFVGTVSLLLELGGALALLPFGLTMSRIVSVYAVSAILSTLCAVLLARHCFPKLELRVGLISWHRISDLAHYAAQWSVTVSTSQLSPMIDKLILARFVGLSSVAIYEAAAKLIEIMKRGTQLFILPVFPLAGATVPYQSEEQTRSFYQRIFRFNVALNAGLYFIPAALSFGLMRIWLGPAVNGLAGLVLCVMAVTQFVLALVYPGVLMLAGTGQMRLLVFAGLAQLALNIFASPLMTRYFGFQGLLIGNSLSYTTQGALILAGLQRRRQFALKFGPSFWTIVIAVCAAVVPGLVLVAIWGRILPWTKLAIAAIFSAFIYSLIILGLRENREIAFSVVLHCRERVSAWLEDRRSGQESQA